MIHVRPWCYAPKWNSQNLGSTHLLRGNECQLPHSLPVILAVSSQFLPIPLLTHLRRKKKQHRVAIHSTQKTQIKHGVASFNLPSNVNHPLKGFFEFSMSTSRRCTARPPPCRYPLRSPRARLLASFQDHLRWVKNGKFLIYLCFYWSKPPFKYVYICMYIYIYIRVCVF